MIHVTTDLIRSRLLALRERKAKTTSQLISRAQAPESLVSASDADTKEESKFFPVSEMRDDVRDEEIVGFVSEIEAANKEKETEETEGKVVSLSSVRLSPMERIRLAREVAEFRMAQQARELAERMKWAIVLPGHFGEVMG